MEPAAALLPALRAIVGPAGLLTEPADTAPYATTGARSITAARPPWSAPRPPPSSPPWCGPAPRPASRWCRRAATPRCAAARCRPRTAARSCISLARLNRVRDIDPIDLTMTVEAGVTLKAAQDAADGSRLPAAAVDRARRAPRRSAASSPPTPAATTPCATATPATSCWGSRSVLPDGEVLERAAPAAQGQHRLLPAPVVRRQRGHARHHHRRGAEARAAAARDRGGAVRAAPRRRRRSTCSAACSARPGGAARRSNTCRAPGMGFVLRHIPGAIAAASRAPAPHYALIELATPRRDAGLRAALEEVLDGGAGGRRRCSDAVIAESEAQRAALWRLREEHAEAQKREGASDQERRLGAGLARAGTDPPRHRRLRGADAGHARGAVRPSRRRQHPLQPGRSPRAPTRPRSSPATTT